MTSDAVQNLNGDGVRMTNTLRYLTADEQERVVGGSYSTKLYTPPSQAAYTPDNCINCQLLDWWW
jgi:hypothetical protein